MRATQNWYETFFEGEVVTMWLQAIPPEATEREADTLVALMAAPPGGEILDVPCGGGRLALPLASRGFRVTGVDASAEFLAHAKAHDTTEQVTWERRDMRDLPWQSRFQGAYCVGNSLGYLDDAGNEAFLRAVRAALVPGGRFVLETPMIVENLLGHIQERSWWRTGDCHLLAANTYDATAGRLETEYTIISNRRVEVKRGSHRVFTFRELVGLLQTAGFHVTTAVPWTREAQSVTFIATAAGLE